MPDELMGVVIFGEPAGTVSQADVNAALISAGMPSKLGDHLNARSWFIRATRGLMKSLPEIVLRDRCDEDGEGLTFAFLSRHSAGGSDLSYRADCVVRFDKSADRIVCVKAPLGRPASSVEEEARGLLNTARESWNPQDLNALVKRHLATVCRQVPLRPGVSFIAAQYQEQAEQVRKFYQELHVPFYVVQVGYSPDQALRFHEAIMSDLRSQVNGVLNEIRELQSSGELTKRKSRARLKELREALKHYRDLAESSKISMDDLIGSAGKAGEALLAASLPEDAVLAQIQSRNLNIPVEIAELYASEAEIDLGALRIPDAQQPNIDVSDKDVTGGPTAIGAGVNVDLE